MHNTYVLLSVTALTVLCAACTPLTTNTTTPSASSSSFAVASSKASSDDGINPIILSPSVGSKVQSPLTVQGKARGTWFFEGSLPVQITDSHNNVIATAPAQTEGEWMTTEYIDFSVTIPFSTHESFGFIVIKKDNPSGLPENDAQFKIPVTF